MENLSLNYAGFPPTRDPDRSEHGPTGGPVDHLPSLETNFRRRTSSTPLVDTQLGESQEHSERKGKKPKKKPRVSTSRLSPRGSKKSSCPFSTTMEQILNHFPDTRREFVLEFFYFRIKKNPDFCCCYLRRPKFLFVYSFTLIPYFLFLL